jgi:TrmH family RNA methyltransferase
VLADGSATTSLYTVDWQVPSVLILGNEAHGPSDWPTTVRLVRVRIPMRADTESLNVAAAAAVFLYEGQRHLLRTL